MTAYYDKFDYPSYWIGREYEHKAEVIAINSFLEKIKSINNLLEIGAGYGRLTPMYLHRAKNIYLSDPSSRLLSMASKKLKSKKINIVHASLEHLENKLKYKKMDLIIVVRVLHHIKNTNEVFNFVHRHLSENGYAIFEFANKLHTKSILKELLRGNFTVFYDIFPKDIRSKKSIKRHMIEFKNYHPGYILELIKNSGFKIIDVRSVSNVRSSFLKKYIPLEVLCYIESLLQPILAAIYFGPSTFVLVQKK